MKFSQEKDGVLAELAYKASLVENAFNKLEGFRCNVVQGAMYAFPQLRLPERFVQQAKVHTGVFCRCRAFVYKNLIQIRYCVRSKIVNVLKISIYIIQFT